MATRRRTHRTSKGHKGKGDNRTRRSLIQNRDKQRLLPDDKPPKGNSIQQDKRQSVHRSTQRRRDNGSHSINAPKEQVNNRVRNIRGDPLKATRQQSSSQNYRNPRPVSRPESRLQTASQGCRRVRG